jgi:uridine kinase
MVNINDSIMKRHTLIRKLSRDIDQVTRPHPVRVAIDGIDNAGKTTLAEELAQRLQKKHCSIIRASIDGFHHPRKKRYTKGKLSPVGYYYRSFDHEALKEKLLKPLGPNGDLKYIKAVFDFRNDSLVSEKIHIAKRNAILLFDGVFLLRPELNDHWDFRIFVHVSFETALERALLRDRILFGSFEETRKRYLERYIPGQKIYLKKVDPKHKADIIIDNNDPTYPLILKGTGINF